MSLTREPVRPGLHDPTTSMSRRHRRGDFCRLRDLAHDLDDVAIRVEDPQLARRAVAPRQDLEHALELALRPELARVRLELAHAPPDELPHGNTVPPPRDEVHHRRLQPIARGQPLVLGREDAMERRDLVAPLVALAVVLDEGLA